MTEDLYDTIVAGIYRAGLGAQPWGEALRPIEHHYGAWLINFAAWDKRTGAMLFHYEVGKPPPQAAIDFIRKYHLADPARDIFLPQPEGTVASNYDYFTEEQIDALPFYREFYCAYGGRYYTCFIPHHDERTFALFGVHRDRDAGRLNASETALLRRLGAHLSVAAKHFIAQRAPAALGSAGFEVLRRWSQPALLADHARRVVFTNEAAGALLERGTALDLDSGLLRARAFADDTQLHLALRALALDGNSQLSDGTPPEEQVFVKLTRPGHAPLCVYLFALRPQRTMQAFGTHPLALVMLHDAELRPELDPFVVAATWDLTPAEARVAVALADGLPMKKVAAAHRVSIETVRSQAKSAYAKIGVRRHAELVRALTALPTASLLGARGRGEPARPIRIAHTR